MRVVVVDDQAAVREGLATLLATFPDVEVVGVGSDGEDAVALAAQTTPDVVLMDLRMPRVDGVEATRRIRERHPSVQVVVLTTYADDESIVGALRAGALGYLTKGAGRADIGRALEAAASGHSLLDASVRERLVDMASSAPSEASGASLDGLSAREAEVLALIAQGRSNAEIAELLFVGRATVKSHVNHILAKTGCRDRAQAIVYARERGLGR